MRHFSAVTKVIGTEGAIKESSHTGANTYLTIDEYEEI